MQASSRAVLIVSDARTGITQRCPLTQGVCLTIGRGSPTGDASSTELIKIRADRSVSRRQAKIELRDAQLGVWRCENAQPMQFHGAFADRFVMEPGDFFIVGDTHFRFVTDRAGPEPNDDSDQVLQHTYTVPQGLTVVAKPQAAQLCLRALAEMPAVLELDLDTGQTLGRIVEMLAGLLDPSLCVSAWRASPHGEDGLRVELAPLAPLTAGGAPPSRRLAAGALTQPDHVHVFDWGMADSAAVSVTRPGDRVRWSMMAPIVLSPAERYLLYIEGTSAHRTRTEVQELQQLVSAVTRHYLLAARAQRFRGQVGQFFSPALRTLLMSASDETGAVRALRDPSTDAGTPALSRRKFDATVMFFDLRGFSRASELAQDQVISDDEVDRRLFAHHEVLEQVLGTVADAVFQTGGIIVDFQGDAAFACWGAPVPAADHSVRATEAARLIIERLGALELPFREPGRPVCGIGITTGPVVAGRFHAARDGVGEGLVKYSVMGTAVNQASRLEGLTKRIGVPVLMSEAVHRRLPAHEPRRRRVAGVIPAGMREAVDVYELILPVEFGGSGVSDEGVTQYESALDHFRHGRIDAARTCLRHAALRGDDRVVEFLEQQVLRYRHEGLPAGFDGIIRFDAK